MGASTHKLLKMTGQNVYFYDIWPNSRYTIMDND